MPPQDQSARNSKLFIRYCASLGSAMYLLPTALLIIHARGLTSGGDPEAAGPVRGMSYMLFPFTTWIMKFFEVIPVNLSKNWEDFAQVAIGSVLYLLLGYLWGKLAVALRVTQNSKRRTLVIFRWVGYLSLAAILIRVLFVDVFVLFLAYVFVLNTHGKLVVFATVLVGIAAILFLGFIYARKQPAGA